MKHNPLPQVFLGIALTLAGGSRCLSQDTQIQPAAAKAPVSEITLDPPEKAYKEAMRPLDLVRKNLENWSDAELGALNKVIEKANFACGERPAKNYFGEDLYELERLCSLGQNWNAASVAATQYIDSGAKPHRTQSYAMSIDCLIHFARPKTAVDTAKIMLKELPYDTVVAQTIWYLEVQLGSQFDPQAEDLGRTQHPILLEALQRGLPLKDSSGEALMSVGTLYQEGMQLAFLERYAGKEQEADHVAAELAAAIAKTSLEEDDKQLIGKINAQYGLLGKPLPQIELTGSLTPLIPMPKINYGKGSSATLLLFPEWCRQCLKMTSSLTDFALRNGQEKINAYGLLVPNQFADGASQPPISIRLRELRTTPTLLTSTQTFDQVGAIDFPFVVVADKAGIVKYVGTVASNAFDPNGSIEAILARMLDGSKAKEKLSSTSDHPAHR